MQNYQWTSNKQEIVPLIQLNRSRRGLQESVSATVSNKHSKDPRLDPSAKEHSCKKLITEPSIVDDLEYSKNSQIQNGRNLSLFISRTPLLSLIRADILLLNVNAENKKDRERRAYTHGQRRVRTKEIYNFVCNISKNRNYISRCLSHPAPVAYTFSLPHSHQQRECF